MSSFDFRRNEALFKIPQWMKVLSFFRFFFVCAFVVSFHISGWYLLIITTLYVIVDEFLPGLSEKFLIALSLISIVLCIAKNGLYLLAWPYTVFFLFVVWYIVSWILSSRWLKKRFEEIAQSATDNE